MRLARLIWGVTPFALTLHAAAQQPNILFIITDDMAADSTSVAALQASLGNGVNGANNTVSTPALESLANQGMVFTNAYNQGGWSQAVCLTTRTAIMTGRSMWNAPGSGRSGSSVANADTMPGLFNAAGYDTARYGKGGNDYNAGTNTFTTHAENDNRGATASQWFADQTVDYLQGKTQSNDTDPYLVYVGLSHPHDPRNAPSSFLSAHGAKNGSPDPSAPLSGYDPLPSSYLGAHPFDNGNLGVRDENSVAGTGRNRDERTIRNEVSKNHAAIEYLDSQVQRTLDAALAYEGLTPGVHGIGDLQNTLIVFTADHGIAVGRHGLVGKQNLYEHTTRVPYIVAGAVNGAPVASGVSDANIYLHDSLPTLLELSGVSAPANGSVQTQSFADALSNDAAVRDAFTGHASVFGSYSPGTSNHVQRSVKVQDQDGEEWKIIHYRDINRTQLYNLTVDPDETEDLSHDPQYSAVLNMLAAELDAQQAVWNDPAHGQLGRIGINMAFEKTATQSSGSHAHLAVNGAGAVESTLAGGIGGGTTLARTAAAQTNTEDNPWWMVDLGQARDIGEIALHNTTETDASLRLSDIRVEILNEVMNPVYTSGLLDIAGGADWLTVDLNANAQTGRYVRVTREADATVLALDEVQVFSPGLFDDPPPVGDGVIQWGLTQDTTADAAADIIDGGAVVLALNGHNSGPGDPSEPGDVTLDGVLFTASNFLGQVFNADGLLAGNSSGDADYDLLLDTVSVVDGGDPANNDTTFVITGLTDGTDYMIQLWFTDERAAQAGRVMTFGDNADPESTVDVAGEGANSLGRFVSGSFTAEGTTQDLHMVTNGFGRSHLTAILVREALDPADLDDDGDVDDADFALAFAAFSGPGVPAGNTAADLDGDGDVDDADFGLAFAAFTGPGAAANVPEPAGLALLGLLAASLSGRGGLPAARRRRTSRLVRPSPGRQNLVRSGFERFVV